ncbi:efhand domain-containing protein [Trypanosoma conorhini]|uniref:Efhand domain-containing protein n=1 Tax=Trypanosoma conorhini TaxID=83891 RepID=A0A3R7LJ16_9TRYP|nr:efhand domain-containing protein [Trypanosoma conorhini]RNF15467.1 efhand domain-containing protein [Trypanosoma conorhini]
MSVPTAALLQTFDLYDTDRVGHIPATCIPHVLRSCGMFSTPAEMAALLRRHFASGDTVTRSEFQKFLQQTQALKTQDFRSAEELATALKVFDTSDAGALTPEELRVILTRMGEAIDADAYQRVLVGLEPNEEGTLDVARLAAHMLRPTREYKLTPRQILDELAR